MSLKPTNLSMREAAALPLVAITAYEGLIRAGVQLSRKFSYTVVPAGLDMSLPRYHLKGLSLQLFSC